MMEPEKFILFSVGMVMIFIIVLFLIASPPRPMVLEQKCVTEITSTHAGGNTASPARVVKETCETIKGVNPSADQPKT